MDQATASQAIFRRWIEKWPVFTADLELPGGSIDGGFAPPTGVPYSLDNLVRPEQPLFARCGILSLDSEQWTLAPKGKGRTWQRTGMIVVRLNGPTNKGRVDLDLLAGIVRRIFEGEAIGAKLGDQGVITHAMSPSELRRDVESPNHWLLACTTPFEYYERR